MKKTHRHIRNDNGSAILIVLGLLAMLTGIAIMSVDRANTDMQLSSNQTRDERAFYLAEAGIERARTALNSDNTWRSGFYKQVLEGGN
jgi:type II secretory pathway component PulK